MPIPRCRSLVPALLVVLVALAALVPAAASAQQGQRATATAFFDQKETGRNTGAKVKIAYRDPADPEGKPFAVSKIRLNLPVGTRIDTGVPAICDATDDELINNGAKACPGESRVGAGTASVDTGTGVLQNTLTLLNIRDGLIMMTEAATGSTPGPPVRLVVRARIEGQSIVTELPDLPGAGKDNQAALRDVDFKIGRVTRRIDGKVRHYLTTPPVCPKAGSFVGGFDFTFADEQGLAVKTRTPCVQPDLAVPLVSIKSLPVGSCLSGRRVARVRIRDRSRLRRVIVRVAGKRVPVFVRGKRVRTTTAKRFAFRVRAGNVPRGVFRVRVKAVDDRGNGFTLTRRLRRCG